MNNYRIPYRIVNRRARVRLFCLPFAGGSAITYRSWPRALPDWVDVCPVELPGRGTRFGDDMITSMKELVEDLLVAILPMADLPVALFGHSMGARVAREVARILGPRVVHVFASASPAAHVPVRRTRSTLSDQEIVDELRRLGGTNAEIFAQQELLELLLPVVRADFAVLDGYVGSRSTPLDCPITAFAGKGDPEVTLEAAKAWAEHTRGPFNVVEVDGGHFFLEAQQSIVLRTVVERLAHLERRPASMHM